MTQHRLFDGERLVDRIAGDAFVARARERGASLSASPRAGLGSGRGGRAHAITGSIFEQIDFGARPGGGDVDADAFNLARQRVARRERVRSALLADVDDDRGLANEFAAGDGEAGFRGEKAADGRQLIEVRRDDACDAFAIGSVQPFHHCVSLARAVARRGAAVVSVQANSSSLPARAIRG